MRVDRLLENKWWMKDHNQLWLPWEVIKVHGYNMLQLVTNSHLAVDKHKTLNLQVKSVLVKHLKNGVISHFRNEKAQCACLTPILSSHALKDADLEIRKQIDLWSKLERGWKRQSNACSGWEGQIPPTPVGVPNDLSYVGSKTSTKTSCYIMVQNPRSEIQNPGQQGPHKKNCCVTIGFGILDYPILKYKFPS